MGLEGRQRIWALIVLSLSLSFLGACGEKKMERAFDLYRQDRHEEALKIYGQALEGDRDSALLNFNAGVVQYRLKNYGEAVERFTLSLTSEDREAEAKANYNIGNCRFRQAELDAEKDPAKAVERYKDALAFYGRALELDPGDGDALHNRDLTGNRIRELEVRLEARKVRREEKPPGAESKPPSAFPPPGKLETPPPKEDSKGGKRVKDEEESSRKPEEKEMTVLSREEALKLLSEYAREEEALKTSKKSVGKRDSPNLKDW